MPHLVATVVSGKHFDRVTNDEAIASAEIINNKKKLNYAFNTERD